MDENLKNGVTNRIFFLKNAETCVTIYSKSKKKKFFYPRLSKKYQNKKIGSGGVDYDKT